MTIQEKIWKKLEILPRELFGNKHTNTLNTMHWIAMCLFKKHQFEKAEKLWIGVENVQKEVLGKKHEHSIMSKIGLQGAYMKNNILNAQKSS